MKLYLPIAGGSLTISVSMYITAKDGAMMFKKITILLEMIKFKLTIFAMPFAFMGAFLAADGIPQLMDFLWILY